MNFEELTRQVGFPLAVIIHSQQVPIGVSFWDNVMFDQWQEVFSKLPRNDTRHKDVFYRMKLRAQTFDHIATLFFWCDSQVEKQRLVAQAVEKANAFWEWRWVYIQTSDDQVRDTAFAKMREVPSTFKGWIETILRDEHKGEYSAILCGKAVTFDDWLSVYQRSGPSGGCKNVARETARERLRELVITAAGWQKIFEDRGNSTTRNPIGLFALGEMAKHASTIGECVFVSDNATFDATIRTAMEGKLQGLDASFGDWQQLFDRKKNLAPFGTIAMQKMIQRAATIKEWQYIYEHSSLQPDRNRLALDELTKLATAEPATV